MCLSVVRILPPLWVHTPKGEARAHWLIVHHDSEQDDQWKCCMQETGEWWTFTNQDVRAHKNYTLGRDEPSEIGREG